VPSERFLARRAGWRREYAGQTGCGGRDRARTCDLVVVSDRTVVCGAAKTAHGLLDQCPW
jgi:hypothetical protein